MFQTDESTTNKQVAKKSVMGVENHQDDFLTQTSDIPVYDVLGRKYHSSPDKLEFFRKSFSLPELKTIKREFAPSDFNPVTKKTMQITSQHHGFFPEVEVQGVVMQPNIENTFFEKNTKAESTDKTSFDVLAGKETSVSDTLSHTIFPIAEKTQTAYQPTLIHEFVNRRPKTEQMQFSTVDWATGLYILLLILLAYTRIAFGRFFQPIFQSAFVYNLSVRIYSEKSLVLNRLSGILNFMFVLTFAAFLTLWFDYYGYRLFELGVWQHYVVFLGLLIALFFARKFIHVLLSSIFGIGDILSEYSFHGNLFLKVAGLLILPIVIVLPYIPDYQPENLFVVAALILAVIYLFRILRTFSITIRKGFSIFYLILYLCALEIGPCLVFFKILRESM
jgi:hypothetical protein